MRMILILRTILIYKKRFPAPEWQNEVKNQWRSRQSGKVKCKHEVSVTQRVIHRLSTSLTHTSRQSGHLSHKSLRVSRPPPYYCSTHFRSCQEKYAKKYPTFVGFLLGHLFY